MTLENRGIPTVVICTAPFTNSALAQSKAFGRPGFEPISIPHPLGPLARDTVIQRAESISDDIVRALSANGLQS